MQLIFILLCFAGLAFMFFCIQRTQERMFKTIMDEHAQIRGLIRGIEARMDAVEEDALNLPPEQEGVDTLPLQPGATVAQATEMLRAAEGFRSLDLDADRERARSSKRMPELKL